MSRVALELGETSIDRAKITPTPDGGYRMQWSMRLLNGRLIKKTTKGCLLYTSPSPRDA